MKFFTALLSLALLRSVAATALRKERLLAMGYSDSVGRTKLMPMCAAAYAEDPLPCVQNFFDRTRVELFGSADSHCDMAGDTCSALVVVSHEDSAIIVAFRGAENAQELNDLLSQKNLELTDFPGGGQVAKWFLDAVTNLERNGLKDLYLAARNGNPDYQVWVTGHNIGGALASLYAATLIHREQADPDKLLLMTFGQPRVGDQEFAAAHDQIVENSFRVVHARDGIVHLPPLKLTPFTHHKDEIWYDNDMKSGDTWQTCQGDDKGCSDNGFLTNSLLDDYYYYHTPDSMTKWGQKGCPPYQ
uniref:Lipase_3 domain-containing protein n=1 Tax=Steinernema glaseri TaxID=37863 RepID=A0A1I7Z269_9BILA